MGVVVQRYIDFIILLIPTPLVSVLFAAASLLFVHLKKMFLFQYFFVIKFYILNNFSPSIINTHTSNYRRPTYGSHMKAAHNVLYMKHTKMYASYSAMDISCMTSRSVV